MLRSTLAMLGCVVFAHAARGANPSDIWARKVQPIFDVQCSKCHGLIEQKSGLALDSPDALMKGGDSGDVVVPGQPEKSLLFQNLAPDADPHMPPKKQLTDDERAVVREWIMALADAPIAGAKQAPKPPREFAGVTEAIDTLVAEGWERFRVQPAAEVDDRTWCRRVFLDLAGRIPAQAEVAGFLSAPPESRRAALVDRLLASDEYAVRMRELWDVYLMGRGKRGNNEGRRKDGDWWAFLETAFRTNRPWNETVRDFLLARPEKPESKGAAWFLYEQRDDYQRIAEAVAPVVYGTKIDCAQCHDHPLAREIKQAHYWGLVAAYNRSKIVKGSNGVAESAVGGFVNFTNLKKESQPALVTLLTGQTIAETRPAGDKQDEDNDDLYVDPKAKVRVPKNSRREAFAEAATHENPLLARAFVNRMWATLTGRGIVHPADDMTARNAPSHPELLDWLAADFASHQYDPCRIIRGIVLSKPYALRAGAAFPDVFAGAAERPLTAEQIARSWRIAAGLSPDDDTLRRAVITALPDVLPKDYSASFQQAQFLTNSPALAALLADKPNTTIARITALPDSAARVRAAFHATLDRDPAADEAAQATAFMEDRTNRPADAARDLMWALMTSAEFLTMP